MRHHEACKSWPSFHPYDCPECKILEPLGTTYTEDQIYEMLESERNEAYQEGQDDAYWENESAKEEAYDEGYKDGQQSVLTTPEDFGLVEAS